MDDLIILIDKDYVIGDIDRNIFGSFVEHLSRTVYGGIYEPGNPSADEDGFRKDVIDHVKNMGVSIIRYPGGNFVSGYNWLDGIGPKNKRPVRLDLAWKCTETNQVGVDEFVKWSRKVNSQVMMAVNLGTGTPKSAAELVEYCNHPSGTYWSDLRIKNGSKEPHNIKKWCLGNEMDCDHQIGRKSPEEYADVAFEALRVMKLVDSDIDVVASGSSSYYSPLFGKWERTILERGYEHIDYVSLHAYYGNKQKDTSDFLANTIDLDNYINGAISVCDSVKAAKKSKRKINLSIDEWNIWCNVFPKIDKSKKEPYRWEIAPAIPSLEYLYDFQDALLVGGILITLLNHCDRVKMACIAQLVNSIAPIMTENMGESWCQTTYYPFMLSSKYAHGSVLSTKVTCPKYDSTNFCDVPILDVASSWDSVEETLTLFILNKDLNNDSIAKLFLRGFDDFRTAEHIVFYSENLASCNTKDSPDKVLPFNVNDVIISKEAVSIPLRKHSWNIIRLLK